MIRKNKFIGAFASMVCLAINLNASNIELNKDFYEFNVLSNRMVVIDFPFEITEKQFLGNKDNVSGDFQDKSLFIKITEGTVDVSIWGGEKPILMTLNAKPDGQRRLSFINAKGDIAAVKKENKEWNHDMRVAEEIEAYSKEGIISGYEKKQLESQYDFEDGVSAYKVERLFKEGYAYEKLEIYNNTRKTIDLFEKRALYFTERNDYVIDAVSFNERYLLPGQKTICFLRLEGKVK